MTSPVAMQGVGARAQERASEVVRQNEQRLQSAFGLLSLVLAVLGSTLLFVPDKVSPSGQSARRKQESETETAPCVACVASTSEQEVSVLLARGCASLSGRCCTCALPIPAAHVRVVQCGARAPACKC